MSVFINDLAAFLPNGPVTNEDMEKILGMVGQLPSRTKKIILRNNRIKSRYYAIDPGSGSSTHTNAQLTAEAVRRLQPYDGFQPGDIECLCCGTSTPDQIMPGHASMVHGELATTPCEIMSAAGVCNAGMSAFKYGWMSVAAGQSRNAVVAGSELTSSFMRAGVCAPASREKIAALEKQPALSFEADFLRWMLSDGAGAAFLSDTPNKGKNCVSLKIEWIDLVSYAGDSETCMYAGAVKKEDGTISGWRQQLLREDPFDNATFLIKQDVKLLNKEIINASVDRTLPGLIARYGLQSENIDWFLPHYSSNYFRRQLHDHMVDIGFDIPFERWFTNLAEKGNTGSASIYIILEELFHSGRLQKGDTLLCFIPESGRFSICYMMLTVV